MLSFIIAPTIPHGIFGTAASIICSTILAVGTVLWLVVTLNEWIHRWKDKD